MPSASYTHTATTTLDRSAVWELLQQAETWAGIGPVEQIWDASHQNGALAGFRWKTTVAGTTHEGTASAADLMPHESMTLMLDTREIGGSIGTILDDTDAGTNVTITLSVTSRGMLSSLFFPAISEAIGGGLPAQVEDFVANLTV